VKIEKRKAHGIRGSWFATVDGITYPCVHDHWLDKGKFYCDPHFNSNDKKFNEIYQALKEKNMCILTNDDVEQNSGIPKFTRNNYIALFKIKNVEAVDGDLKFELTERFKEL
jgi:hypothetical protein